MSKPDFWEGYVPEPVKPAQDSGVVTAGGFDPRTQRTWVGLTDEQFQAIRSRLFRQDGWDGDGWDLALKEAIEAKLKERNA